MPSVLLRTLGCKLNQLESEAIAGAFLQVGFALYTAQDAALPSLVIINTCTVTSKADQKARAVIRKALRDYPGSCVIVTGCYAQLNREDLCRLETGKEKRLFVFRGSDKESILTLPRFLIEKNDIHGALINLLTPNEESAQTPAMELRAFQFSPERFCEHTRAFLKIQDGCDKHCTYCRIRLARGPSASLDAGQALQRLQSLEKTHAEAVLTGVNICQYRDDTGRPAKSLAELLEYLLAGTEKISLRLSSLAPEFIDDNFVRILSHKRIRPHFHLSIQSGSAKILGKMGRAYNAQTVEKAAFLLRRAKNDPFLACDIIAGFPGETESDFEETFALCKKLDFAWIHAFPYSKRPGTPAYSFPAKVHEAEVTKRVKALTSLANQGKADYVRRWLGREVEALVEKGGNSGQCRAVSENYLKLLVNCEKKTPPGAVLRCILSKEQNTGVFDKNYDCRADIIV